MKKITLTFLVLIAFVCNINYLYAQENFDTIEIQRNPKGKVNFARFKPLANIKMQNEISFLKSILKAKPEDELKVVTQNIDELGFTHKKFQQYYKSIKVDNAEYATHWKNGNVEVINGDFKDVKLPSVNPAITTAQALSKALSFVNAKKYKWVDPAYEKFIKSNNNDPNATYYPKGELVITEDYSEAINNFKLAWKFVISTADPFNEILIYVDANTGDIIRKQQLISHTNTPGTAQTNYSGTRAITGDSFTGGFRLRENRNGVDVQTLNVHKTIGIQVADDFTDNDNNWTAAEYNNTLHDQVALDAHWASEMILDYWRTMFNRNSIDGLGLRIRSYVHFGYAYDNAYWDQINQAVVFGDGDVKLRPTPTLDISAHEFSHGLCHFSANLTNNVAQESAALNEGFSDIWGAAIEQWAAPTKQTWLIGEDITLVAPGYLRSLSNPQSNSTNFGGRVDTYHGTNWYFGTDASQYPYANMTVLTHWFYLLSQGGTGWNNGQTSHAPAGSGYKWGVSGIGIDNAARIAYRAETNNYLTPTSNYTDARNATISSARDIFGAGSCQEIAVTNAWNAVGVGNKFVDNTSITTTSTGPLCSGSQQYTLSSLTGVSALNWTVTPTGIANPASGTGNTFTITRNGTASGAITLTANYNKCSSPLVLTRQVSVGTPSIPAISLQRVGVSCYYDVYVSLSAPGTIVEFSEDNINWSAGTLSGSTYKAGFLLLGPGYQMTYARTRNSCGIGPVYSRNVPIPSPPPNCNYGPAAKSMAGKDTSEYKPFNIKKVNVYPNPANKKLIIEVPAMLNDAWVNIYSAEGKLMYNTRLNNTKSILNFSSYRAGLYLIKVMANGQVKTVKIIKE